MRLILNIFLIVFLIDGCISILDSLLNLLVGIDILSTMRTIIAFTAIAVSVPVYVLSGINKSLPKKLFFPLCFFLFWVMLTAQPVTTLFSETSAEIFLAVVQLMMIAIIFSIIRLKSDSWLITDKLLPPFSFSKKNTLLFFTGNFFLVPIMLLLYFASSIQLGVYHNTAGFVRLSTDGIYMKEKVYSKENKTIRLIGMIHIGESDYYKNLEDSLVNSHAILLAEGVSDKNKLLQNRFSAKGLAEEYDLASQEDMNISGTYISEQELVGANTLSNSELSIFRADVDTETFSEDTINFLNAIGEHFLKPDSFSEGFAAYNNWLEKNLTDTLIANIRYDIIDQRNQHVIRYVKTAVDKFDTIVVPWGAMHMPAIEKAVKELGFTVKNTQERLSVELNYSKIKHALSKT